MSERNGWAAAEREFKERVLEELKEHSKSLHELNREVVRATNEIEHLRDEIERLRQERKETGQKFTAIQMAILAGGISLMVSLLPKLMTLLATAPK